MLLEGAVFETVETAVHDKYTYGKPVREFYNCDVGFQRNPAPVNVKSFQIIHILLDNNVPKGFLKMEMKAA